VFPNHVGKTIERSGFGMGRKKKQGNRGIDARGDLGNERALGGHRNVQKQPLGGYQRVGGSETSGREQGPKKEESGPDTERKREELRESIQQATKSLS